MRAFFFAARPRLERGVTVLEIMVALAVIGLMAFVGYRGLRDVRQADLREDAVEVAAALRMAHTLSIQAARHHRVLFDMDAQQFQIQRCEGDVRLEPFDPGEQPSQEELAEALEGRLGGAGGASDLLGTESPREATERAVEAAGERVGTARCQGLGEGQVAVGGGVQEVRHELDIHIRRVYPQSLRGPADEGEASVNFFPLGTAERALVEVATPEAAYTLRVHRLSGRIEFQRGELEEHIDFMEVDALGDREEER